MFVLDGHTNGDVITTNVPRALNLIQRAGAIRCDRRRRRRATGPQPQFKQLTFIVAESAQRALPSASPPSATKAVQSPRH